MKKNDESKDKKDTFVNNSNRKGKNVEQVRKSKGKEENNKIINKIIDVALNIKEEEKSGNINQRKIKEISKE